MLDLIKKIDLTGIGLVKHDPEEIEILSRRSPGERRA